LFVKAVLENTKKFSQKTLLKYCYSNNSNAVMFLSQNLRYLRRKSKKSQQALADEASISRGAYSSYEEGRAEPRLQTLQRLAQIFEVQIDNLVTKNLEEESQDTPSKRLARYVAADSLRVLAITVDENNNENIEMVPEKAAAGYTKGYTDVQYLKDLPKYRLPFLPKDRTYRAFEITGDSMLPLQSGTIVIGEYVTDWHEVKDGQVCVVVLRNEGIVLKKVFNKIEEKGTLLLKSTNPQYDPYELEIAEVGEVWRFVAYIGRTLPQSDLDHLRTAVQRLEERFQEFTVTNQ
jgi:transcriptional regulator with XRE-family HTH domain